jgi:hypothetical protein
VFKETVIYGAYMLAKKQKSESFTLNNLNVSVFDTNPFSAGTEKPNEEVVRVTVRGVPLSVEDSCVIDMLQKLGEDLTS